MNGGQAYPSKKRREQKTRLIKTHNKHEALNPFWHQNTYIYVYIKKIMYMLYLYIFHIYICTILIFEKISFYLLKSFKDTIN